MKYMKLDQKGKVMAEYIWIDGSNGVRSKTKVRECTLSQYSFTLSGPLYNPHFRRPRTNRHCLLFWTLPLH